MGEAVLKLNLHQMTIDCYNQQASYWGTRFLGLDTGKLCQRFLSYLPEKAHILDMGCGPGRDTKYFLDHDYQVTAFDAAEELVKLAQDYTRHPILHMTFEEMIFQEEFDGIWSMASLLHLSHQELITVVDKNLIPALKPQGILYSCFLEGEGDRITKGRYFTDYTKESLESLLEQFPDLTILDMWVQEDNTPDRKGRNWVNCIVKKR
jgi:2-polyprenyl-3-methyl-5-hydroxy-6-metoxy-1,4-benzoquinol methylase